MISIDMFVPAGPTISPQTPDLMRQQQARVAPPHGQSHAQSVRITSGIVGGDDSTENGTWRISTAAFQFTLFNLV